MGGQSERDHPSLLAAVSLLLVSTAMNATVLMPLLAGEVEEPNDLRWDLARKYQLTWESVQLSSGLRNLAQGDELSMQVPDRTLTIGVCENKLARCGRVHYSLSIKGLQDKENAHE
jgi:hypothetical protein